MGWKDRKNAERAIIFQEYTPLAYAWSIEANRQNAMCMPQLELLFDFGKKVAISPGAASNSAKSRSPLASNFFAITPLLESTLQ